MGYQSGLSARRRWVASEKIALGVLEELGYSIVETGKKIILNGVEVGEVDVVAVDSSNDKYAVEVKAGRIDVSGVRQAFVNAMILGAKPLVVCKGFADEAARELAEKLGVRVIQLSDVFLVESEEIYTIVREVIEETLTDYLEVFYGFNPQLKQEQVDVLYAIYSSQTIDEAAGKLGLDPAGLARKIDELRKQGVIPKWAIKYPSVKRIATIIINRQSVISALEESRKLVESVKQLEEQLKSIQSILPLINQQLKKLQEVVSKLESSVQVEESK
jgi:predicted RecB family endonuclease